MRVLVACECSGVVRRAFRRKGHDAWSCDTQPADDGSKFHYHCDARLVLDKGWDLLIAHPPCQYMTKAGARYMFPKKKLDLARYEKALQARALFMDFLEADIERVAVENPTPLKVVKLPTPQQVIQPYQFGHPHSKRTLLWLKNLPPLRHTRVVDEYTPFWPSNKKARSVTFGGVAAAMADQWSGL